ncbi:MAG: hypothetical protein DI608_05990 [Rothia mucilaginosa]|nr:MAG: hypothetical protein DI608_05990 [Rothia mucilaginosa]
MTPEELSEAIALALEETISSGQLTLVEGAELPAVRVERPKSQTGKQGAGCVLEGWGTDPKISCTEFVNTHFVGSKWKATLLPDSMLTEFYGK